MADDAKRRRWEAATVWPGLVASVAFLVVYSWTVLEPAMPDALYRLLVWVLALIWVAFLLDYVVRLRLAEDKRDFIRHNVIDLLSVLIPLARPFRLIADLFRLPSLRGNSGSHLRRRVVIIAGTFVLMFIYVISLAVYQVERYAPGSNIRSFGDSLWWACVTMATVGYGDYYPVTVTGRLLAIVLMIGGIAIVGTASATIVSYLSEQTQQARERRSREHEHPQGGTDDDHSRPDHRTS
ncbi:potassium channel family protein [uncultured Leifsonia sp.]|uniref:potassium channel family protein n=1 Tax=uncultured Leifsonia sp. TaxID=340359 RepID=UPI0025DF56EF|nr:potassium channel family protein [uncultured Leifsonia sp.]